MRDADQRPYNHEGVTNSGISLPDSLVEVMVMGNGSESFYDAGYYNIGVRPIEEDIGRSDKDPFG